MPALQDKTQAAVTGGGSALARYRQVIVGHRSLVWLIYFELCGWMAVVPGAIGLLLRRLFWPRLFAACGRGTVFGAGVSLLHPHRIALGARVVVSDGCVLDGRNDEAERSITIGDDAILGNRVMISCKGGTVRIGRRTAIGTQTVVHAVALSQARLGDDLVVGPGCYIAAGGNYETGRTDVPIALQGLRPGEDTTLEGDNWLGAKVTVLPGVTVGQGTILAAGAVIAASLPARVVAAGVPARVVRQRDGEDRTPGGAIPGDDMPPTGRRSGQPE